MKDEELLSHIKDIIDRKYKYEKDEAFYIVDLQEVVNQYNKWVQMLPNVKPFFAMKSNPDIKIIRLLAELGCNFDCASKSEICTILNVTDDPNRIIFANPCKSSSHIEYAKRHGVSLMTFDCIEELYKIKEYFPEAHLLLRLCVDDSNSKCKFNSKFGCLLEDIEIIIQNVKKMELNLKGFSFHVGSGCQNARSYYSAIRDCRFAYMLASKYGIHVDIIDIGGGFCGSDDDKFEEMCKNIRQAQNDFFKTKIDKGIINFIAEPGRFFTETTHTLCVSVIGKKSEDTVIKYYLNDGVYGSFNCIHYDHQEPVLIPVNIQQGLEAEGIIKKNSIFFGPTCDSMDVIYKNIPFEELEIGNWLYVKNFGAYTCSPSSTFNGFQLHCIEYIYPKKYDYDCMSECDSTSSSFSF